MKLAILFISALITISAIQSFAGIAERSDSFCWEKKAEMIVAWREGRLAAVEAAAKQNLAKAYSQAGLALDRSSIELTSMVEKDSGFDTYLRAPANGSMSNYGVDFNFRQTLYPNLWGTDDGVYDGLGNVVRPPTVYVCHSHPSFFEPRIFNIDTSTDIKIPLDVILPTVTKSYPAP